MCFNTFLGCTIISASDLRADEIDEYLKEYLKIYILSLVDFHWIETWTLCIYLLDWLYLYSWTEYLSKYVFILYLSASVRMSVSTNPGTLSIPLSPVQTSLFTLQTFPSEMFAEAEYIDCYWIIFFFDRKTYLMNINIQIIWFVTLVWIGFFQFNTFLGIG